MLGISIVIILCFLIASAWLHYLRKIDLFEKERMFYVVVTFILGAVFPFVIYPLHRYVFDPLHIVENGHYLHDFLFYTFGVGAIEETIKFIPAVIALVFMKRAINEPIDFIKYTLVSSLGFAFVENIEYSLSYGINVLISRSILAVPAHMFFSALFVYGIVLYKYQRARFRAWVIPLFILASFVAHGFYDFSLNIENGVFGILLTVLYFFILMSLFVTILNNCLNNSPFFNPKLVIDTDSLRNQVALFYLVLIVGVVAAKTYFTSESAAARLFLSFLTTRLFILTILVARLCRFKLIHQRWNRLRLEFPFTIRPVLGPNRGRLFPYMIVIRGEGFNEVYINAFFHEHFTLAPLGKSRGFLEKPTPAFIESKFHLKDDETFFVVKLTINEHQQQYAHYLLKAKTTGITRNTHDEPIAALLAMDSISTVADKRANSAKFRFLEWVVLEKK